MSNKNTLQKSNPRKYALRHTHVESVEKCTDVCRAKVHMTRSVQSSSSTPHPSQREHDTVQQVDLLCIGLFQESTPELIALGGFGEDQLVVVCG